jgi:choline dehydrogenase-like flavoprotein
MLVDPSSVDGRYPETADVCVFGSGPAGLTVARSLALRGRKVFLVEAGGFEIEDDSQELYEGEVVGDRYFRLDECRLRMFGGSMNHWGGWTRPLDASDFYANSIREISWPIGKADLDPYHEETCKLLNIDPDFVDYSIAEDVDFVDFRDSKANFASNYRISVEGSNNLKLFLNSMLTGLVFNGRAIESAKIAYGSGHTFDLVASHYVLCLGGIENSRMLAWFNRANNGALVANSDLIGRYWMEHPQATFGYGLLTEAGLKLLPDGLYQLSTSIAEDRRQKEKILNSALFSEPTHYENTRKLIADFLCFAPNIGREFVAMFDRSLNCGVEFRGGWEQKPIPENRVALADTVDSFGVPLPILYWRNSAQDHRTIKRSATLFAEALAKANLGRVRMMDWLVDDEPPELPLAGSHHMGGTRMSNAPNDGIVDRNLQVHGVANLYLGGSSVFPTGGFANPTFTIIQLALRLADHLENMIKT